MHILIDKAEDEDKDAMQETLSLWSKAKAIRVNSKSPNGLDTQMNISILALKEMQKAK